jgi:hypothetical protein
MRDIPKDERQLLERKIAAIMPRALLGGVRWCWDEWPIYDADEELVDTELAFVASRRSALFEVYRLLNAEGYPARLERGDYETSWQDWGEGDMLVLTGIRLPDDLDMDDWQR